MAGVTGKEAKDVGLQVLVPHVLGEGGLGDNDQDVEETIHPLRDLYTSPALG